MSEKLRAAALAHLATVELGQSITTPVLAEAIGVDPDDLQALLAYPVAQGEIYTWRAGAVRYWRRIVRRAMPGEVVPDGISRQRPVADPEGPAE